MEQSVGVNAFPYVSYVSFPYVCVSVVSSTEGYREKCGPAGFL